MFVKAARFSRMFRMLLAGEVTLHSFKLGLNIQQRAVCRKSGPGMVLCDQMDEKTFFAG